MLIINSLEQMKLYYNYKTNTYEFIENGMWLYISFDFNVDVESDITAWNINARNINAWNINARDINAGNINARDINVGNITARDIKAVGNINAGNINALDINAWNINALDINARDIKFYAICYAYENFKCNTIKGIRKNAKYFCLDNEVEFIKEEKQ